jgi:hypothetical protein
MLTTRRLGRTWHHKSATSFIPVVAGAVVVAAVAVNLLLTLIAHRRTELLRHWVFLGAAYSLVASALPMRYLGLSISSLHKKGPAKAIAFNRALSPAGNVGVEGAAGGTSVPSD